MAWARGWPAARLYRAAAWSLPMTLVYVLAAALQARTWRALALAPVASWEQATRLEHTRVAQAVLTVPWAVPAGLAADGAAWARHCWAVTTGISGGSAFAASFDMRQWRRQSAAARGALAAPGIVDALAAAPAAHAGTAKRSPAAYAVPSAALYQHQTHIHGVSSSCLAGALERSMAFIQGQVRGD